VIPVDIESEELLSLPAAVEVAAYRIVVEAVTNAIRHASASRCRTRRRHREQRRAGTEDHLKAHHPGRALSYCDRVCCTNG
jgi:two-component sensor histidine kinase